MFDLKDKVAIVTGSASGIGESIAATLIKQGVKVVGFDMTQHPDIETLAVDVSKEDQVLSAVEEVIAGYHKVDILINNAGVSHIGTADETSEADFDRVFNVNTKGVFLCMKAVVPFMKQQGHGVILNMASVAASSGIADRFAYSATKGAVKAMTLAAAKDYLSFGIRCNSISPARVHTPFVEDYLQKNYPGKEKEVFEQLSKTQPIGRMATAQEVAALAAYLCSDEASFITGTDYPLDGGFLNLNT